MYGIIDIGSNTIRLVLYTIQDGKILPTLNKKVTAGLAGYVRKGHMTEAGTEKLLEVLTEFRRILDYIQIQEVFCLATASLRNIDNAEEVCKKAEEQCGFAIRILSGEEEALYDYFGVLQSVNEPSGLVLDIGGGSTEFVFYEERNISKSLSIPIGSLTAYTRHVREILPTKKEQAEIARTFEEAMSAISVDTVPDVICGVGGSIRAAVKVYNTLFEKLPPGRIETKKLAAILDVREDRLTEAILKTAPERIHTFVPGLVLFCTAVKKWNIPYLTVSTSGVKEGYLFARLQERGVL